MYGYSAYYSMKIDLGAIERISKVEMIAITPAGNEAIFSVPITSDAGLPAVKTAVAAWLARFDANPTWVLRPTSIGVHGSMGNVVLEGDRNLREFAAA
jgi:hypothetical protein